MHAYEIEQTNLAGILVFWKNYYEESIGYSGSNVSNSKSAFYIYCSFPFAAKSRLPWYFNDVNTGV